MVCKTLMQPFMFRWKWLTSGRFGGIVILLIAGVIFGGLTLFGDLYYCPFGFEIPESWEYPKRTYAF